MYNDIGLKSPRDSGLNGYVQKNLANINARQFDDDKPPVIKAQTIFKKSHREILEHERKRKIELKCAELEDLMEQQGYHTDEIETKVNIYRESLLEQQNEQHKANDNADINELVKIIEERGKDTHQETSIANENTRNTDSIYDNSNETELTTKHIEEETSEESEDEIPNRKMTKMTMKLVNKDKDNTPTSSDDSSSTEEEEVIKDKKRKHKKKTRKCKKKDGKNIKESKKKHEHEDSRESGQISESVSSRQNSQERPDVFKKIVDEKTIQSLQIEPNNLLKDRSYSIKYSLAGKEDVFEKPLQEKKVTDYHGPRMDHAVTYHSRRVKEVKRSNDTIKEEGISVTIAGNRKIRLGGQEHIGGRLIDIVKDPRREWRKEVERGDPYRYDDIRRRDDDSFKVLREEIRRKDHYRSQDRPRQDQGRSDEAMGNERRWYSDAFIDECRRYLEYRDCKVSKDYVYSGHRFERTVRNDDKRLIKKDSNRSIRTESNLPIRRDNNGPIRRDKDKLITRDSDRLIRRDNNGPIRRDNNGPIRRDNDKLITRDSHQPIRRDSDRPIRRDNDRATRRDSNRPERKDGDRSIRRDSDRPVRRDNDRTIRRDSDRPTRRYSDRPIIRDSNRPTRKDNDEPVRRDNDRHTRRDEDQHFIRDGDRPIIRRSNGPIRRGNDRPIRDECNRSIRTDDICKKRRDDKDTRSRRNIDDRVDIRNRSEQRYLDKIDRERCNYKNKEVNLLKRKRVPERRIYDGKKRREGLSSSSSLNSGSSVNGISMIVDRH